MNPVRILKTAVADPGLFALQVRHKIVPETLWPLYSRRCRQAGVQSSKMILSFDCDTDRDFEVVGDVHARLKDMNIHPVYFVPGELLLRGEKHYRHIFDRGAVFENHGGVEHTVYEPGKGYRSTFFYDHESADSIADDFRLGHQIIRDLFGVSCRGWRTPHFGTFQRKDKLEYLYHLMADAGYVYSTSTIPTMSYRRGPVYRASRGIYELPVTGAWSRPFDILDSWGYYAAPDRAGTPDSYRAECMSLGRFAAENPVVFNIYADPSQIYDQPTFFEGMAAIVAAAESVTYDQFLDYCLAGQQESKKAS